MDKKEIIIEQNYVLTEISYDRINETDDDNRKDSNKKTEYINYPNTNFLNNNFNDEVKYHQTENFKEKGNLYTQASQNTLCNSQNNFAHTKDFVNNFSLNRKELSIELFDEKKVKKIKSFRKLKGDKCQLPDFDDEIFDNLEVKKENIFNLEMFNSNNSNNMLFEINKNEYAGIFERELSLDDKEKQRELIEIFEQQGKQNHLSIAHRSFTNKNVIAPHVDNHIHKGQLHNVSTNEKSMIKLPPNCNN